MLPGVPGYASIKQTGLVYTPTPYIETFYLRMVLSMYDFGEWVLVRRAIVFGALLVFHFSGAG